MDLNKPEFLHEVSLRICSHLEVSQALNTTFEYLKDFFPVCECFFQVFDKDLGSVRNMAYTSIDRRMTPTARNIIPFTQEIWDWSAEQTYPYRVNKTSPIPTVRDLANSVNVQDNDDLCLPLNMGDEVLGVFVLRTCHGRTFSQEHVDLIDVIKAPLSIAMSNALAHEATVRLKDMLLDDNQFLTDELQNQEPRDIIGKDGGLREVMEMVRQVSPLSNTVLLLGETGVGKEVIANAIHHSSQRRNKPFIKLNCGAIPESLIDSELFGHEKGAFTGAVKSKRGRFERAHTGTLFLDEIGELPLEAQVKLLRVIQHHEIERVGSTETIPIDVRIIAATHRNLEQMTHENRFRKDLWFRLNIFPIVIPPLRERPQDVFRLARYFIQKKCRDMGIPMPPDLAPGALTRLEGYPWPGNVRELENLIERELIRHPKGPLAFTELLPVVEDAFLMAEAPTDAPPALMKLDDVIETHIRKVMAMTGGKVSGTDGAAELLGLKNSTLRARMKKLGIPFGRRTQFDS